MNGPYICRGGTMLSEMVRHGRMHGKRAKREPITELYKSSVSEVPSRASPAPKLKQHYTLEVQKRGKM